MNNNRRCGILVHPSSLPSPFGIGDFGNEAYEFIDFMKQSNQKVWQMLPLCPVGNSNSPYQSYSSFAGNELLISPQKLLEDGLLTNEDLFNNIPHFNVYKVDYPRVKEYKSKIFKIAYNNFLNNPSEKLKNQYDKFVENNKSWLNDYALFMALKDYHNNQIWHDWPDEVANATDETKKIWKKTLKKEVKYHIFIQYIFHTQWFKLKKYANKNGIDIIGDIPIFVAYNSADVWANKDLFYLDEKGYPSVVAGVPPDYFSPTGQLWGNPLYNWNVHKKQKYKWWIHRISHTLKLVDIVRIDHFRGFQSYWEISYGARTAINGTWKKGPGSDFFNEVRKQLGTLPIIAEDLGIITPEVEDLRDEFNLPGMRVLQFGFESDDDSIHLPHHYIPNCVVYTGTHDNNTTLGWYQNSSDHIKDKTRRYLNTDANVIVWDCIRAAYMSVAELSIIPIQDFFNMNSDARMNTPGIADGNWEWRFSKDNLNNWLAEFIRDLTILYGR